MKKKFLIAILLTGLTVFSPRARGEGGPVLAFFGMDLSQLFVINGTILNPVGASTLSPIAALTLVHAACWSLQNLGAKNAVIWARAGNGNVAWHTFSPTPPRNATPAQVQQYMQQYMNYWISLGYKIRCSGLLNDLGLQFTSTGLLQQIPPAPPFKRSTGHSSLSQGQGTVYPEGAEIRSNESSNWGTRGM